jgi:hypothetical protein
MFKNLCLLNVFLVLILLSNNSVSLEFSTEEQRLRTQYLSSVNESSSSNNVLVAILIASQLSDSEALDKFYTQGSVLAFKNILWLDQTIKRCLFSEKSMICNPSESIIKLKELDQYNGLPYVYSAIYHARKNDMSKAYEELNSMPKKKYDDFYWKRFSILLETLKETAYPREHLYTASIKYSHNMVIQPYQELMHLCKEQSSSRPRLDWRTSCINIGKLLENKGTIFFANMVGFALQREALKNDVERLKKVTGDRGILNQWRINAVKTLDFIEAQKKGPDSYYRDLVEFGERRAVENALKSHSKS